MKEKTLSKRHFLLLQGPHGPFFNVLAKKLAQRGAKVSKINFNAGDAFFYSQLNTIEYSHSAEGWPSYIADVARLQRVTDLVVFDDSNALHSAAIEELKKFNIKIHVFAEGYFDKNFITFEQGGTNANSELPQEPMFYMRTPTVHMQPHAILQSCNLHKKFYKIAYALTGILGFASSFKPRPFELLSFLSRKIFAHKNNFYAALLMLRLRNKKMFLFNAQNGCEGNVRSAITNFAKNAKLNQVLLINLAQVDKNCAIFKRTLTKSIAKRAVKGRVFIVDCENTAALIAKTDGVIVHSHISAIAAIAAERPVLALGKAIFNFAGLTNQVPLKQFWLRRNSPNQSLFSKFKNHVTACTQLNGNFYGGDGIELAAENTAQTLCGNRLVGYTASNSIEHNW